MKKTFTVIVALTCTICAFAQNTVIKAGHVFDARTGRMLDNQTILIEDGKIKQIGKNLPVGKSDSVIDLSDSYVLPGLMDCHVHVTFNEPYRKVAVNENYATESTTFRALRGAMVAKQFLDNGFTTIKEIGNDANYATADIIKAISEGWIQGPTIIYAGKIIAPYGGQSNGINPEHEHFWKFEYLDADTPDEIKKAIRINKYNGATVIKMVTGDNGIYNEEDIRTAVNEAKKYGMKVTVHTTNDAASATNVIMGGAAGIEHGFELNDTQLKLMKEKGTFLVGTDFSFENWYAYGMDSAFAKVSLDLVTDRLKRAYTIGIKMAFGTDIVVDLPGLNRVQSSLKILQTWKAAGIPASYILQAMTLNAAELLGLEKSRGVLEGGFAADIIAVKTNPLTNIDAIKAVHFVMKDGVVVKK